MTTENIERLYTQHVNELRAFAQAMCQNETDADDIVQDVFLSVLENAGNIEEKGAKAYLYRSVHNRTIDFYRKTTTHNDAITELEIADCDSETHPELHKSIACLPDKQAVAIYLHYWKKLDYEQIADEMQCPINSVHSLLYRAKNKLREMMRNG